MMWRLFAVCIACVLFTSNCYANNGEFVQSKAWVIYLALSPTNAGSVNDVYHANVDIKKYKYPLYVGYVYTLDGKTVCYKSFTPLTESFLKEWSDNASRYILPSTWGPSYKLGDEEYVIAASIDLAIHRGFAVIMRRIGVRPDETWRPQFKESFMIDDNPSATETKMASIHGLYRPQNELPGKGGTEPSK